MESLQNLYQKNYINEDEGFEVKLGNASRAIALCITV